MKSLDYIPTNKIARAGNLVTTGLKLGGNYLKYYGEKALKLDGSRDRLDEENAKDIYNSLKTLKGSALKVAQMLSMEKKPPTEGLCRPIQFGTIFRSATLLAFGQKNDKKIFGV